MTDDTFPSENDDLVAVEEHLVRLSGLRRHPRYRQILAEGTGFEGRTSTAPDPMMRIASRGVNICVAICCGQGWRQPCRPGRTWERPSATVPRRAADTCFAAMTRPRATS